MLRNSNFGNNETTRRDRWINHCQRTMFRRMFSYVKYKTNCGNIERNNNFLRRKSLAYPLKKLSKRYQQMFMLALLNRIAALNVLWYSEGTINQWHYCRYTNMHYYIKSKYSFVLVSTEKILAKILFPQSCLQYIVESSNKSINIIKQQVILSSY